MALVEGRRNVKMWNYDRRLMYPVKIKNKNPELAKFIIAQYGGPNRVWI